MRSENNTEIIVGKRAADHVIIEVGDLSPSGWIDVVLDVCAGPWRGKTSAEVYVGTLRFAADSIDRLYSSLIGTFEWRIDPYLKVIMTGDGKGHICVQGNARSTAAWDCVLSFQFLIDQTELLSIARALRAADPA